MGPESGEEKKNTWPSDNLASAIQPVFQLCFTLLYSADMVHIYNLQIHLCQFSSYKIQSNSEGMFRS